MNAAALQRGTIARSGSPAMNEANDHGRLRRFEEAVLPHLDTAYDLARWLTKSDRDAEDVVQTACLRALQFFAGFRGANPRAWLLAIVRNTFYTWLQQNRAQELATPFDEERHTEEAAPRDPEADLLLHADRHVLRQALEALPVAYREAIVLRELEGLSYREIAEIAGIPIGTVMSRLARARRQLQDFAITYGSQYRSRFGDKGAPS
jgi:RNA polymerase sigma-70 factor (ECF subfamily)